MINISWTKRQKMRYMKKMLLAGTLTLTIYTVASLVLAYHAGTTPPDALTYALFGFWGIEGGWSALIRVAESKEKGTEAKAEDHP